MADINIRGEYMKKYILCLFFVFGFFFQGCDKNTINEPVNDPKNTGNMLLKFNKTETPSNVASVTATLTRQGFSDITGTLNITTDTSAEISLQNIAAGNWHLKIDAKDNSGTIVYAGETDVTISAGIITNVSLTLNPIETGTGGIYIHVGWGAPITDYKWSLLQSGTTEDLQTIFFINPNTGWCGGTSGAILQTTNGGATWIKQSTNTLKRINSIYFVNESTGWAVGESGLILKTTNGGTAWIDNSGLTQNSLYHIRFYNEISGYIVGAGGTIIKINTSPADSLTAKYYSSALLLSSYFINSSTGWVVGAGGTIIKTTDGGFSWFDSGTSGGWQWLQAVYFFNENSGLAVGGSGSIIKTANGGKNWSSVNSGTSEHLEDFSFISPLTGWTVGDHGTVLKTTDAGGSWVSQSAPTSAWLNSVFFVDQNNGWCAGNNGVILKYKP